MHSPCHYTSKQHYKSAHVQTLPKDVLYNYQMVNIHLIDGVYQGFVNSSYQRDGFGVILNQKYELYMGFFKYNKMHGLGLMIFDDGSLIYGHFNQGKLEGVVLTDNMGEIQVGMYQQEGLVGIGFQYLHQSMGWKMNKYHRCVPIETYATQQMQDVDNIPEMLNFQPQILQHLIRYKTHQFFPAQKTEKHRGDHLFVNLTKDVNKVYFHQLSPELQFYGAIIDTKYEGIGVLYNPTIKTIVQAGIYSQGILHGFGMKNDLRRNCKSIGRYVRGKKEGLFIQKMGDKTKFVDFISEQRYNEAREQNETTYKKYQRLHNYREKDFLSIRHGIEFQKIKIVFESQDYKIWKLQAQNYKKQKQSTSIKPKIEKVRSPSIIRNNYAYEKPSILIMQQKITEFKYKKKQQYATNPQKKTTPNVLAIEEISQKDKGSRFDQKFEEAIAVQQNPLVSEPNSSKKIKFNFKTHT